jgi:hypothetical protein
MLTVSANGKGVLDVDTVKGCSQGMAAHPDGGCYGECYAAKIALARGFDFTKSVSRILTRHNLARVAGLVHKHRAEWYRIGVNGDPSHDWENTVSTCEALAVTKKTPVIVTKHWTAATDNQLSRLAAVGAVFNTSTSGMDTDSETAHRTTQISRVRGFGMVSVCRVVTCKYGCNTDWSRACAARQALLLSKPMIIDTPFRAPTTNERAKSGEIILTKMDRDTVGGHGTVSLYNPTAYMGTCDNCPDQCGVKTEGGKDMATKKDKLEFTQEQLFHDKIECIHVESVIGSGYEEQVAKLAVEDGVAYRAARKNMQIHSAIILKINDVFSGFFTFQVNHDAKEFCLLQSAMLLDRKDKEIYKKMLEAIIERNTFGYPMVMTVSTKHDLERPDVLEDVGFQTYLMLSGFAYMVHGTLDQVRMKRLAHATMTNAWTTTRSDWLKMKKEWNAKIEEAGEKYGIPNPKFASRDGCWQGSNGYSNVVLAKHEIENGKVKHKKGKSFNGNASVLDPVACEVILRFFMPTEGKRVYNPFGGGVQFGFITGSYGHKYIASEIRQNQCDANNKLCSEFPGVKWIQSDSSTYSPRGKFDLVFSCPPYYKVEKYLDYDGKPPEGEINSFPTYEAFRDALFSGYKKAIEHMNDNRFFVIMIGDSRDKNGGYHCAEAETELFLRDQGLMIYNRIVYLECEFTRLAHAKRTLDYRKFPKREQKIIVAYKGDPSKIKELYPPIGRL